MAGACLSTAPTISRPATCRTTGCPATRACYTCHTTYAMFGDMQAKLNGITHVWVNYFGAIPATLALYRPYDNRECLHCHEGARSFEEQDFHVGLNEDFARGEVSCLDCHLGGHDVSSLDERPMWTPTVEEGMVP